MYVKSEHCLCLPLNKLIGKDFQIGVFFFAIVVSSCLKLIYQIKALQIVLDEKAI